MIKIVCDRCGAEITDGKIGRIGMKFRDCKEGPVIDNPLEEKDFCSSCMKKIEEFVIKTEENVSKPSESDSIPPQSVSVPAEEMNTQKGTRRKIDVGKVMALKKAGWSNKAIGEEMGLDSQAVANVIYQQKKKAQANLEGAKN